MTFHQTAIFENIIPNARTLTLPDGKRKYYRGVTKEEAEEKRDQDKALMESGINIADNPTFKELAEIWFHLFKEDLHAKSKEIIRGILTRQIYPSLGDRKIREIKPADILFLMRSVSTASNSLQRKVLQYVRSIFAFAVDNDLILKSPVLSSIKAAGSTADEVEALSDQECAELLEAVRDTRAYLFVELILYTGLRRGEALGLMWSDIDFARAELNVCRSIVYTEANPAGEINAALKTANARRKIPVMPWLLEDLNKEKPKATGLYVFSMRDGRYLSKSSFRALWNIVNLRCKKLGFDVHPHQLRHTCITKWVESGMDIKEVQYYAGHASADITLNIYAHYRRVQRQEEAVAKMLTTKVGSAV